MDSARRGMGDLLVDGALVDQEVFESGAGALGDLDEAAAVGLADDFDAFGGDFGVLGDC